MAKSKKTKKEEVLEFNETNVSISQKKYEDCEWCFQFDEDEPHVFAWTNENETNKNPEITFTLSNVKGSNFVFKHSNGKVFKLFARELTDIGREKRKTK